MNDTPVMLISGTSRGIGRHLAEYYAANGYMVVGCSRGDFAGEIPNYRHIRTDISDEAQVKGLLGIIRKEFGRLDVLVNNAGLSSSTFALLASAEHIKAVYDTNVLGTILVTREAVKFMKRRGFGRIVNISSVHVPLATIGTSIYSSAKGSVEQFARVISREFGPSGVTVNNLGLSYVRESGMISNASEAVMAAVSGQAALDVRIDVSDVVYCLDIFLDRRASCITGQTLYTSGIA